jgi:hypothetical protein
VCDCEVGYDLLGSDCAWVGGGFNGGGFLDGEIADPTAWFTNQVTIDENEHGAGNGVAEPELAGACGTSGIGQVIQMPPYSSAEPFVVEVGVDERGPEFECKSHPMLIVGETYQRLSYVASGTQPPDQIGTACLPVTGYGPDVPVVLVQDPQDQNGSCEPSATRRSASPMPSTRFASGRRCPESVPPRARCRTATSRRTPTGRSFWTPTVRRARSGIVGRGPIWPASRRCARSAHATQTVTFPAGVDLPNPALRFSVTGTLSETLQVQFGEAFRPLTLAQAIGTGGLETATICIPRGSKGPPPSCVCT